ncbi:Purine-cytosine permease fcyB [Hyphodiscus hymeniophilus]|uniref:Purine-cytosine permease fcyB n=1 Tax=Hyphodiscus hymeniophilus TaxID=353542 RepID=A0A9P6VLS1_9HELO|nr:Purine-cytosine permease fcyB [Hyphodiscus hymeniophilus]
MADFVHGDQADRKASHDVKRQHEASAEEQMSGDATHDVTQGTVRNGSLSAYPDPEKGVLGGVGFEPHDSDSEEVIRARELQQKSGFLRSLRAGEEWLDRKMGIETQGIDRIHEEDKQPPSILNVFFLWWSLTCHVGTLPIGVLGPEFGLTLNQSIAMIVVGTMMGALCTSYCGTLGPKLGLRAIATSRYSFGFYGAKLASVLNVVIGGGFAVVNVVVVGQILAAVSDYTMSIAVGCVIIAIIGYVISIFGFAIIHTYEKYSWIVTFIILCILIGQVAPHVDPSVPGFDTGLGLTGSMLSFLSINFSSSSGWCSIASDYYCNYPANTKSWKIFFLTFFGISIPTIFVTVIGACLGNAAVLSEVNPILTNAYDDHGLGGLLRESFHPLHFSKFCLVLLVFSVIGNNVAVNYSSGLSLQLLGHYFHAIPRFIWSLANAVVIAVLAIAGRQHLSTIVSNFVSLLGYWTISFTVILLIEDQVFRRREGYNLNVWDVPAKLPWGLAAVVSLLCGYLAGGVTGMSQTWYIGPIAAKFGGFGGDVGIYLSFAFTLFTYPPLRWYERKRTGR